MLLQQRLPFTVLKRRNNYPKQIERWSKVATALTVYGIETKNSTNQKRRINLCVATALTVYGIETKLYQEKFEYCFSSCNSAYRLRY